MKNYYKNFIKSFNIIHVLIITLLILGITYLSSGGIDNGLLSILYFSNDVLTGTLYFVIPVIVLLGLNNLKTNKIDLLDLVRHGTLFGVLGGILLLVFTNNLNIYNVIILGVSFLGLLAQILVKALNNEITESLEVGIKKYASSLAVRFNPLVILLVGIAIGAVLVILFRANVSNVVFFQNIYLGLIFGCIIITSIILPLCSDNDANFIDALMISIVVALVVVSAFSSNGEYAYLNYSLKFNVLLLALVSFYGIFVRALKYNGSSKESTLKLNNYYKEIYAQYDLIIPIIISVVAVLSISGGTFIYPVSSIAIIGLCILGLLIHNNFKSKEITYSDYFLNIIMIMSIISIPVILNFGKIEGLNFIASIVYLSAFVLGCVLTFIRIKFYGIKEESLEMVEPKAEEVVLEQIENEIVTEVKEEKEEVKVEVQENVQVQENVEESIFDDNEESIFDDEDDDVEEAEAEEVDDSVLLSIDNVNGLAGNKNVKRKFSTKLMLAPDEAKYYYSEIKNYLQMYRANGRYSSRCETFRYKGLVAKVGLAGKSIKVYLALNPSEVDSTRYNFKDASDKKQYQEVPLLIKVKSARGLKYFKELVDLMMAKREVKPKRKYEPVDYTISLIPNGEAIFTELGVGDDYIYDTIHVKNVPSDLPDELIKFLPNIQAQPIEGDVVYATVHLDTLCNHFNDGDIIDFTTLKNLNIINRGNALRIKARGTLDRKLVIFADDFDADSVKMILCTNGTAVKVVR